MVSHQKMLGKVFEQTEKCDGDPEDVPRIRDYNIGYVHICLPKGISNITADFAERFVWNNRRSALASDPATASFAVEDCKTVGELKAVFDAFLLNHINEPQYTHWVNDIHKWCDANAMQHSLQNYRAWYADYETKNHRPAWKTLHHLTFEKCLFALSVTSGVFITDKAKDAYEKDYFKSGFLRVFKLREKGDQAQIVWLTNIDNYLACPRSVPQKNNE